MHHYPPVTPRGGAWHPCEQPSLVSPHFPHWPSLQSADQNGICDTRRAVLPHSGQAGAGSWTVPSTALQHGPHIQGASGSAERFFVQVPMMIILRSFLGTGRQG